MVLHLTNSFYSKKQISIKQNQKYINKFTRKSGQKTNIITSRKRTSLRKLIIIDPGHEEMILEVTKEMILKILHP